MGRTRYGRYEDGDEYYGYKEDIFIEARETVIQNFRDKLENPELADEFIQIPVKIARLEEEAELLVAGGGKRMSTKLGQES